LMDIDISVRPGRAPACESPAIPLHLLAGAMAQT
jgi:hypothetical protein